jgi:hypothetical protein
MPRHTLQRNDYRSSLLDLTWQLGLLLSRQWPTGFEAALWSIGLLWIRVAIKQGVTTCMRS